MKNILLCFFVCFLLNCGFAQEKVHYIKILDTVFFSGFILFENKKDDIYLINKEEIKKDNKTYQEIKKLYKQANYRILKPEFINTPYVYDSSEVAFKKDTISCKQQINYNFFLNNGTVIYNDKDVTVSAVRITGLFYKLLVLDKHLYSKKRKLKYNHYLAFYCYDYRDRNVIFTPK